jgi:FG-GAP repeat/Secretion system C-terminal sorting domain
MKKINLMSNTSSILFTKTNLRFKVFFPFFKNSLFFLLLMLKNVCLMAQTNQCQVSTISDAANQNTIYVCAGDGKPDLANLKNSLNATQNYAYVLATVDNKIIKIITDPLFDLESAPANAVLIWGFNYTREIIAKQGESVFTTPFSKGCYYISRNCIAINRVNTEGGTVKTTYGAKTYFACQADPLNYNSGFQNMNAGTAPYLYLLTDNNNTILEIITRGNFDFNTYPKGNYRVWGLSYTGQLSDVIGKNAATFKLTNGCFDLSDDFVSITVGSPSRHNIAVLGSSSLYFELDNNTNSNFSLSNTASNGAKFAYMVVDENQKIVKVLTQSPYDLSFLSVGKYFIWGVSYLGDLNATIGKNIFDGSLATGCYHISDNAITLQKKSNIDCVLRGTTIAIASELKATTFPIDLKATSVDLATVPNGYEVLYLLLNGDDSDVIRATSNTASFSITDTGKYAIGVLIGELSDATNANYINPNTLVNTSVAALKTANSNKCFSVNMSSFISVKKEPIVEPCSVKVATIVVDNEVNTTTFPIDLKPAFLDLGTVPNGYEVLYLLLKGEGTDIIRATSNTASFSISDTGKYAFGVLIAKLSDATNTNYINPNTLVNTSISTFKTANTNKCFSINVSPFIPIKKTTVVEPCVLRGATIDIIPQTWVEYTTNNSGLAGNNIISISVDKQNNKWFGTSNNGVSKFDGTNWITYNTINSGLPQDWVISTGIDSQDVKWFLTIDGLTKFNGTAWTNYKFPPYDSKSLLNNILTIDGQGNKWVATYFDGVLKLDNSGNWTVYNTTNSGIASNLTSDIAIDLQGNKWIVTTKGVSKFDGANWTTYNSANSGLLSDSTLSCVIIDKQGNKWFGDNGGISDVKHGVTKFDGTNWVNYNTTNSPLTSDLVRDIVVDAQGVLWFATNNGISKFDGTTWANYNTNNSGIVSNSTTCIAFDTQGYKWFGSFRGISKFCDNLSCNINREIATATFPLDLKPTKVDLGTIPSGYEVLYLLFKGENSDVIRAISSTVSFSISDTGKYAIGVLIGELSDATNTNYINPNTLINTSIATLKTANINKCFSINTSALISVIKKTVVQPCILRGATITVAVEIKATTFPLDLKPTSVDLGTVPSSNEVLYLLFKGDGSDVIRATSSTASFSISDTGRYAIGVLIGELSDATNVNYINPNTLINTSLATFNTANAQKCFVVSKSATISVTKTAPLILNCGLTQQKIVASDRGNEDEFGSSVAVNSDFAIVGSPKEDDDVLGANPISNAGSAYISKRQADGTWKQVQKIVASDRALEDQFGYSVAINGNYAFVGAWQQEDEATNLTDAGCVYVFKKQNDSTWTEIQKLTASDRSRLDFFSNSMAVSGDNLIVGAYQADGIGTGTTKSNFGSAYIFQKQGDGTWKEVQKIVANDKAANDKFGFSVAISGDQAVVGTKDDAKDQNGSNPIVGAGSAYIYKKQANGSWTQVQKIVASNRGTNELFGYSVAISNDYVLVGVPSRLGPWFYDSPIPIISPLGGAIFFKKQINETWVESQTVGRGSLPRDNFGISVAISGDYAVMGKTQYTPYTGGIAISYKHENGKWTLTNGFQGGPEFYKDFGRNLAIDNTTVIVGDRLDRFDALGRNPRSVNGSAYLFSLPDPQCCSLLGNNISTESSIATNSFPVVFRANSPIDLTYVPGNSEVRYLLFKSTNPDVIQAVSDSAVFSIADTGQYSIGILVAELNDATNSNFINPNTLVKGQTLTIFNTDNQGKCYKINKSNFTSIRKLLCSLSFNVSTSTVITNTFPVNFKATVNLGSLPGNIDVRYLLFNSINPNVIQAVSDSIVFSIADTGRYAIGILAAELNDVNDGDYINPNTLVKGQTLTSFNAANQGKCFRIDISNFSTIRKTLCDSIPNKIVASDRNSTSLYGRRVDISGDYAIVGAYDDNENGLQPSAGAAYIYKRNSANQWKQVQKISSNQSYSRFGYSVAIDGNYAVIGAPYRRSPISLGLESGSGTAYIYQLQSDGFWKQIEFIRPSDYNLTEDSENLQRFGVSVDISANTVIIGSDLDSSYTNANIKTNAGSAYIFQKQADNTWKQMQKLLASDRQIGDNFGIKVKISKNTCFVSAYKNGYNANGVDLLSKSGSVYVFQRQSNDSWLQTQKLVASDRKTDDEFGDCIDISGDYALVTPDKGRVNGGYIFKKQANGTWLEIQKLPNFNPVVTGSNNTFYLNAALNENYALIGVYGFSNQAGKVLVFQRQPNDSWVLVKEIMATDSIKSDAFGYAIAMDDKNFIVSAITNSTDLNCENTIANAGSAYIFPISSLPQALTQTGTSTNTFNMKVAPNPLQDQVEVFLQNDESKPTDVLLYDAFGKLLFSKQKSMERQLTIDMNAFADGLYILIAKQGENQAVQKLIKTNSR